MEWYVYYYNMNTKAIESFNIFNHSGFVNYPRPKCHELVTAQSY